MYFWVQVLGIVILLLAIKKVVSSKLESRHYKQECARRGCLPAPTLHSNNLLGTSRLKESIKATKEDRGPQYIVSAMNEVGKDNHTVRVPILDYELLVTRDPENAKAMLSTQSVDYDISATRSNAFMPLMGEGIFTSRGAKWKHSRALLRPQFARDQISNISLFEKHVRTLLALPAISVQGNGWTPEIDLQPFLLNFTLDVATEFLYGQSVHSQTAIAKGEKTATGIDGADFSRNLDAAKHFVDKRGALGKFSWLMRMKQMNLHCAAVHEVINSLIDGRLLTKKDPLGMEETATKKFVLLDELAKETQDRQELRNETIHTLVAGRDTTGALLGWAFYFLARHPEVYAKLRKSIIVEFGNSTTSDDIDSQKLRKCEYIQHVLNEANRVAAVVPMSERCALRDTTLPRGGGEDGTHPILVREGTQVLIPIYAIQHRPDIWGKDVEEFRPERWEGRKIGWEWVPFGGGPRKCLGQQFAFIEASYLIVRFLQRFDRCENMEKGDGEIKLHTAIENRSGTGVKVRFHQAAV